MYDEIREYVSSIAPGKEKLSNITAVSLMSLNDLALVSKSKRFLAKGSFAEWRILNYRTYRAMHVIDVNSGNRKGADGQESNALATNIEAAEEIARVLQLRDMGGIICVDFIDMHEKANNKALFEKMKAFMKPDRAKHNVVPPSRFGVVEITRQRVRPETEIKTGETCPTCNGKGEIQASILFAEEIESNIEYIIQQNLKQALS